jgi:deoxyribodipyrimidine photo-lyase
MPGSLTLFCGTPHAACWGPDVNGPHPPPAAPRSVAVALFTGDLRVHDNPVLQGAIDSRDEVVPLFVLDSGVERSGFLVQNRAVFLADCLADLDASLRARGGRLVIRSGDVVGQVLAVSTATGADSVHVAAGPSRYAHRRAQRLAAALGRTGRRLHEHEGALTVVPPGAVAPDGKDHYAVFTPYLRRWSDQPLRQPLDAPERVPVPDVASDGLPARTTLAGMARGELSPGLPAGGESAARRRLAAWEEGPMAGYAGGRDDLSGETTSRLSPDLHFGCLSPVEVAHRAHERGGPGAGAFLRQLAWRDFHVQVLAARPDAAWNDYRPRGDRWRSDARDVAAWKDGRTGYPIVDAAMRQLREEGWMPNRCRMLAASFLSKTLYIDWRIGARHFLDLLVDGDVASNQLNWQWVAGTGTDTRPNRVLNPTTQARRFDPHGDYVRRWVPELAGLDGASVHRPWVLDDRPDAVGYAAPIVGLEEGLARFRRARGVD